MTKDEIRLLLPGRELDTLVAATVMEWVRGPHGTYRAVANLGEQTGYHPEGDALWPRFAPSTDINAAMAVLCAARQKVGSDFCISPAYRFTQDGTPEIDPSRYACVIGVGLKSTPMYGETISHAICLAALYAVGEGKG